jgi:uncharacterized protein (TIGR03435 family)
MTFKSSRLLRLAAFATAAFTYGRHGQTQSLPRFEIASIKPSRDSADAANFNSVGGKLIATNVTARELIRFAFAVKDYQIARAPSWIDDERYEIAAQTADVKRKLSSGELQSLVRGLLADRFALAAHPEVKMGRVYLLVIGKNGPKLTPHDSGAGSGSRKGCGRLSGKGLTVETIATVLSRQLESDVIDHTGLTGKYDFQLDWTPDSSPCPALPDAQGDPEISFFRAIEEQLGLRLESSRGLVEILVVDRVERPSEN